LNRKDFFVVGDFVDFMYQGNIQQGNVRMFHDTNDVCNINNYRKNTNYENVPNDDVIKLSKPKQEEQKKPEKKEKEQQPEKDESEKEEEKKQDENLTRFESLRFFVNFFLNEEKAKDYRRFINYYLLEDYKNFHHQSFWILDKKIVEGLDLLSAFDLKANKLEEFLKIDQAIMSNISMLSIVNRDKISKLADIKNIPAVLYELIQSKLGESKFKDFVCKFTKEDAAHKMNFYFTDSKLMLSVTDDVDIHGNLLDLFVLNVNKSIFKIYGKVKNVESDKYIFNTYLSNLKKISYYEIFNYICYVLIWKSSLPNTDDSDTSTMIEVLRKFIENDYLKNLEQYNL
jgi:hypothetical protein